METVLRYVLSLVLVVLLTRWLTRKFDPASDWKDFLLPLLARFLLGSVYGYIFLHQYGGDDTWMIHTDSMVELDKLLHRPLHFFEDINLIRLVQEEGWRTGFHHFREKLELALLIKPLALVNLLTNGQYYSNILFFNAAGFWGSYWLYLLFKRQYPGIQKGLWLSIFFYMPALFWLSGIRSDGLLFLFFSGSLWNFYQWLQNSSRWKLFFLLLHLSGMLIIRPAYAILLAPGLIAWWFAFTGKWPALKYFGISYGIAVLLFFTSSLFPVPFNGPAAVMKKQASFLVLPGKTRVPLDSLEANPLSFIRLLPQAVNHSFTRPYPGEAKGPLQWLMVIQNLFIICLALTAFLIRKPVQQKEDSPPLVKLLFFFALLTYLSIGYTIPFPGAIVRYRAIPETCLLLLFVITLLKRVRTN